jgi:L-ascorbate metabolism protein UlaG (beta-lactamase superfamily)
VPDRVRWLGHATVLVELDGVRLLTDPLLRSRVLHLRRAAPLDAEGLEGLDAVLISHVHYDHLDLASLGRLDRGARVLVPRGAGKLVARRGFRSVEEVVEDETVPVGPVAVRAVPARHGSSRVLGTRSAALGYVLEGSRRIYFAGDTDLFPGMAELGPVDVGLIPIWGWGPGLGKGHLDPQRAAEAAALVRPRVAVPIHWGTYFPIHLGLRRAPRFVQLPPVEFLAAAEQAAPDVDVRVLRPGESLELSD